MVWKGVDFVIDALAGLPEDVHLLVAGDGDMLEPWKQHARARGLAERVHFLGNVPYAQIQFYIRESEVLVLHSAYDGLSRFLAGPGSSSRIRSSNTARASPYFACPLSARPR